MKTIEQPVVKKNTRREARILIALSTLRILEEEEGYIAVFAVIRQWISKPVRGEFK